MDDKQSYLAVINSLLLMRVQQQPLQEHTSSMLEQIHEGWRYVRAFRVMRAGAGAGT